VGLDSVNQLGVFRLPVQYVNRPNAAFRGYCGTVAAGEIRPGERVVALPSGKQSRVKAIVTADGELARAGAGQAITLTLEDEIDISRGDMLVRVDQDPPAVSAGFESHIVWMSADALQPGRDYLFKLAGRVVPGRIERIVHRIDVNHYTKLDAQTLALNEIGLCHVVLDAPVIFDPYRQCRHTGSFIVIDRLSNATVACGMIEAATEAGKRLGEQDELARLRAFERELNALVRKYFPQWGARDLGDLLSGGQP
jgi:sulfate adenylyltransferase subunit 1